MKLIMNIEISIKLSDVVASTPSAQAESRPQEAIFDLGRMTDDQIVMLGRGLYYFTEEPVLTPQRFTPKPPEYAHTKHEESVLSGMWQNLGRCVSALIEEDLGRGKALFTRLV